MNNVLGSKEELERLVDEYLDEIKNQKSLNTYKIYSASLERFLSFFKDATFKEITEESIKIDFTNWLRKEKELSDITILYTLERVKVFINHLYEKGYNIFDPANLVEKELYLNCKKKCRNRVKETVDDFEAEKILNYWNNLFTKNTPIVLRNQLIIELLFNSGLMVSEIVSLKKDDVVYNNNSLNIKSKTKTQGNRVVKLTDNYINLLEEYIKQRNDNFDALFTTHSTNNLNGREEKKLYPRDIERLIKKTIEKVNISKTVTPRIIRNTFVAKKLLKGEYMKDVASELGIRSNRFWGNLNTGRELNGYITLKKASEKYKYSGSYILRLCKERGIPLIRFKKKIYLKDNQIISKQKVKK